MRAGEGIELVRQGTRHGHRYELLAAAKGAQRRVQPFLVTLTEQRETFPLFQHVGVEFLYALEGPSSIATAVRPTRWNQAIR